MLRSAYVSIASAVVLVAVTGCSSGRPQWEVTVENASNVPCSIYLTLGADGASTANMEGVAKGKAITLIVGDTKTIVQTVRVVRGNDEQTLSPKQELPTGKRYIIVVGAEGKIETSVSDR